MDLACTADGPRDAHAPGVGARQPAEERREAHDTDGRRTPRTPTTCSAETQRPGAPSPRPRSPVSAHQGSGPSLSVKVPVGPSGPRAAIRTTISAPSSTLRVPVLPLRSVLVKPGAPLARPGRPADGLSLPEGGRRRAVGLRREELPCSPASRSTTSSASNRAGRPAPRDRSSRHRPAPCVSTRTKAPTWFHLAGLAPPGPDTVPAHLTPSGQRLLDRLVDTPVVGLDAAMTLLVANPVYAALMVTRPRCAAYHATASGTTSSACPAVSAEPRRNCGIPQHAWSPN